LTVMGIPLGLKAAEFLLWGVSRRGRQSCLFPYIFLTQQVNPAEFLVCR